MKILFICLSPIEANSSAMMRNISLINGLLSNQCEIDFVTIPPTISTIVNNSEVIEKINVVRLKGNNLYDTVTSLKKGNNNFLKSIVMSTLRKIYHKFTIFDYTSKIAKQININILPRKEYDLIISSSDPKTSHIAAFNLINQGLKYSKWFQYWGDPMALDITNQNIYPSFILRKIEKNILKNADRIIYVSPCTLDAQKRIYPELSDKMNFMPIPYKEEKIYPKVNNSKYLVGYFGAYMKVSRDITPLYNVCSNLNKDLNLIIMGETDCELEGKENITIYPRGNVEKYEARSDLLVCVLNKKGTQIPGKVYHYAATNKPILIVLDGENKESIKNYLEPFNRYVFCENTEEDISRAIKKIMKEQIDYEPCKAFDSRILAKSFLKL